MLANKKNVTTETNDTVKVVVYSVHCNKTNETEIELETFRERNRKTTKIIVIYK